MSVLHRLEKGVRRLVLGLLSQPAERDRDGRSRINLSASPGILVIRVDRLGDALTSTPVLRALRERYPDAKIDILLGEKNAPVGPLLPDIDERMVLRRGRLLSTIGKLKRNRYDVVLNLHLNRSASASLVSRLARGRHVVEHPAQQEIKEHVVCLTSRILMPLGIAPIDHSMWEQHPLRIILPPASVRRAQAVCSTLLDGQGPVHRVFLNVSASVENRRWPAERWGRLADGLARMGFLSILCGTPEDTAALAAAVEAAEGSAIVLPPTPSYPDFAANLALADIVVTTDGSTVHLAAALGKPTVALYTAAHMAIAWAPWGVPNRTISSPRGILDLQPAEVLSAVESLGRPRWHV
ncbi:MAG: lipopolysaccharide heptosyltransferase family protein [Gemmatimonadales bacterium]|nr:MAG: lipopolysaccharide heptosyltransferase family protein [Gemmatimonadales bacterium]